MENTTSPSRKNRISETAAVVSVIILLVLTAVITLRGFQQLHRNHSLVKQTHDVLMLLEKTESFAKDAETGQRGFLITGREDYLEPFDDGVRRLDLVLKELSTRVATNPKQLESLSKLRTLVSVKIAELRESIAARRTGGIEAAQEIVNTNRGKRTMDSIRDVVSEMRQEETKLFETREKVERQSYQSGLWTSLLTSLVALSLVGATFYLIGKNRRRAERSSESIQTERERLRVTLASIGDAVIVTDTDGLVTSMNFVAESLTGWTMPEALDHSLSEVFNIVNETTRQPVENPAFRALNEGVVVGLANHTILIARDGTETPIDDSAAPIRDGRGELIGCVLVFRDISERKRDEEVIAEQLRLVALRADLSSAMAKTSTTSAALQDICQTIVDHLDMAFVRIWTIENDMQTLELQASAGIYTHLDGAHSRVPVGQFKIGRIASKRAPHLSNSVQTDPEVSDSDWAEREGMQAFAGFPLMIERRVVGVLAMFARHTIAQETLKQLEPLADGIAQFIDRKQFELRLRQRDDQLRLALDSAELGTWQIDPNTLSIHGDQRFKTIFGITSDHITYDQAIACLHVDDRGRVEDAIAATLRPQDPTPYAIEYRVVHPDDTVHWVYAKGRGNRVSGRLTSFDGTVADITDRKRMEGQLREAEAQFRLLADNIPQLAWIADAGTDGQVHWFNQNWYDYTGTTLEQMKGLGWHAVHHPEHATRVIEKFSQHVRDNRDWEDTFPLRRSDGQYRWFLSRMKVIRNESGDAVRIFGTNTDVTEQRELAEQLRINMAALSESDRRKNEFLATLAHELRNPLAPIKNAVQLMGMTELDNDTEELRQTMARQVEQLVRLIDDLMDVSRISRGKIVLRREVIDLAAIVAAAVEASSTFIAESGQRLTVDCPDNEVFVNVDPARITQVISNLLNNSAKYSDAGCEINLSVRQVNEQAHIEVRDNGIGIAPDRLQDIFHLFSQVNDTLERGAAGLGIGLTLVKTLVEMHGGSVWAESAGLGQGSCFTLTIPSVEKAKMTTAGIPRNLTNDRRAFKILIVEDQRALRVVLRRLLEKMGHEVQAVDGGTEAIATLETFRPEMIFSDISMPGMTGYELANQLRRREDMRGVYFVAMTGFGQQADRELAIESGFDEHMVKPVDVDRLQDLFDRLS